MNNYRKSYHKGKFKSDERAKHLRPYLKRVSSKRWRKVDLEEDVPVKRSIRKAKKKITVKVTTTLGNGISYSEIKKFRRKRDALNAISRSRVIRARFLNS